MRIGDLSLADFSGRLAGEGLALRWGPFVSHLVNELPELSPSLHLLYADFPLESDGINDFRVRLISAGLSGGLRRQAKFLVDDVHALPSFPRGVALSMFEWGLNWCVYSSAHQYLILHAAVVAMGDQAMLLSGRPGAGKSTLCAALVASGWRLLSDELTLVDPRRLRIAPLARPVCLKEDSISLIKRHAPAAVFGPNVSDTRKGTVAHMRPPTDSVRRAAEPATARWILFPRFDTGASLRVEPVSKARAFMALADNSFNYEILGKSGFDALGRLVDGCTSDRLSYSSLEAALDAIATLTSDVDA